MRFSVFTVTSTGGQLPDGSSRNYCPHFKVECGKKYTTINVVFVRSEVQEIIAWGFPKEEAGYGIKKSTKRLFLHKWILLRFPGIFDCN